MEKGCTFTATSASTTSITSTSDVTVTMQTYLESNAEQDRPGILGNSRIVEHTLADTPTFVLESLGHQPSSFNGNTANSIPVA